MASHLVQSCLMKSPGAVVKNFVEGGHAANLISIRRHHMSDDVKVDLKRVESLTKSADIVLFMKGDPSSPNCGFSSAVCKILEMHGAFNAKNSAGSPLVKTFDILDDPSLRQSCKVFSDWPTFPQVYIGGQFIGGCDIILELHKSGKLQEEFKKVNLLSTIE